MTKLLVNIDVDDLAKAEAFYCGALGLEPGRRFGAFGVELLGGTSPIYLLVKAGGSQPVKGSEAKRDYARHWTPVHLDIEVEDLDEAVRRLESLGAIREGEIGEHAWGRIAMFADPFGHGLCLIQFSERGYDAVATNL